MSETMKVRITGCTHFSRWYEGKVGQEYEVYEDITFFRVARGEKKNAVIKFDDCEIIQENNVQSSKRPNISQEVINGFTAIIDAQDEKGVAKYGRTIDDANDADYSWPIMALEEMADYSKYLVREIKRLEKENSGLKAMIRTIHSETGERLEELEGETT